jgi:hypothetical protein
VFAFFASFGFNMTMQARPYYMVLEGLRASLRAL